ncbi:acyl carrier protein [Nocardia sp. NPDC024068]|uniref:acyl carrier protein n=1 Tax=Nocardia sp. NPDC024068 TaxID=3157197 RepID=UPI0033D40D9C
MSDIPIREYIAEFLRTHTGLELDEIPARATLDDLEVDSLTVLSLIVLAEKNYGRVVPEREAAAARTFGELMNLLGVPGVSIDPTP